MDMKSRTLKLLSWLGDDKMWLEVEYEPTSLFSFKNINATNTAATSLLFPTPYAVKMALIGNAIRLYDIEKGKEMFDLVKKREIKYSLPQYAVVNKTFGRIIAFGKNKDIFGNNEKYSKPAYREYVFFQGTLKIAINVTGLSKNQVNFLITLLTTVNYFGKKGSFMQFINCNYPIEQLDNTYVTKIDEKLINGKSNVLQLSEDIPENATFDDINIYNSETKLSRDNNKIMYSVSVEQKLSGQGYQYYKLR